VLSVIGQLGQIVVSLRLSAVAAASHSAFVRMSAWPLVSQRTPASAWWYVTAVCEVAPPS
jgi:hypothetical protein